MGAGAPSVAQYSMLRVGLLGVCKTDMNQIQAQTFGSQVRVKYSETQRWWHILNRDPQHVVRSSPISVEVWVEITYIVAHVYLQVSKLIVSISIAY